MARAYSGLKTRGVLSLPHNHTIWMELTRKAHPWGGLDIKSVCVVTPPRTGVCPGLHSHTRRTTAAYPTLSCCLHFAAPNPKQFWISKQRPALETKSMVA